MTYYTATGNTTITDCKVMHTDEDCHNLQRARSYRELDDPDEYYRDWQLCDECEGVNYQHGNDTVGKEYMYALLNADPEVVE